MKKIHILSFLKVLILCLFFYNIFTLSILYTNNLTLKKVFWTVTPYDYNKMILSPNNFSDKSLLEKKNQKLILEFLDKNKQKNYLDVSFWNYKMIIEGFDKKNIGEFEKTFYKNFILSKNNPIKNLVLKKNFISNYKSYSKSYREMIIKKF